jgi:hypothetical protein
MMHERHVGTARGVLWSTAPIIQTPGGATMGCCIVSETIIFLHLLIVCVTYMITTIHTNPGFTITHIIAISPTKGTGKTF